MNLSSFAFDPSILIAYLLPSLSLPIPSLLPFSFSQPITQSFYCFAVSYSTNMNHSSIPKTVFYSTPFSHIFFSSIYPSSCILKLFRTKKSYFFKKCILKESSFYLSFSFELILSHHQISWKHNPCSLLLSPHYSYTCSLNETNPVFKITLPKVCLSLSSLISILHMTA